MPAYSARIATGVFDTLLLGIVNVASRAPLGGCRQDGPRGPPGSLPRRLRK